MGSAGLRWEVKGMIVLLFVLLPGIFAGVQHRLLSLFFSYCWGPLGVVVLKEQRSFPPSFFLTASLDTKASC